MYMSEGGVEESQLTVEDDDNEQDNEVRVGCQGKTDDDTAYQRMLNKARGEH